MGEVLHVFQAIAHGQPVREYEEAFALENKGFKDCIQGRPGKRQLLLMDSETIEEFGIVPGQCKENITTRGIKLDGMPVGQRMRIGEALLEVTQDCKPCHLMDAIRPGLQEQVHGRRGVLCRVVKAGRIQRGDQIKIVDKADTGENKKRSSKRKRLSKE
jgi:MOSC domain-containing protein YiiM